jgi:predicted O-methyltransferase YrrM
MNAVLRRILSTKTVIDDRGASYPLVVNVPCFEGEFLQDVIRKVRPSVSLEIGLAYGVSTLYICDALAEVGGHKHIVCDPDQCGVIGPGFHGIGLKNVRDAGYENIVEFHPVSSHALLPQLEQQNVHVQFAFIDGWHTFDYTFIDFFYIDRVLDIGGVIVFDDTLNYLAIRKVLRYILTHRKYAVFGSDVRPATWKRRLLEKAANLPLLRTIARADIIKPDYRLQLNGQFIAICKLGEDRFGDGSEGTRRWDQHFDF